MKHTDLINLDKDKFEELNNEDKLMEYHEIKDTPFTGVKKNDSEWLLVMGDSLVTKKKFEDIKEMEQYVNNKPWELIIVASSIFRDKTKQFKNDKNNELE